MRALGVAAAFLAVVVLGGCDPSKASNGTTVPRATTSTAVTTSTTPEQRYAVPATITSEYVNEVLAALNEVYGGVVRKHIETRKFEPADLVPLRAIYYDGELQEQSASIARSPLKPREEYHAIIGERLITVDRLLTATPECVSAEATYDFSAIAAKVAPPSKGWLSLRPKRSADDPERLNPTPWQIASESNHEENKCA